MKQDPKFLKGQHFVIRFPQSSNTMLTEAVNLSNNRCTVNPVFKDHPWEDHLGRPKSGL